MPLHLAFDYLAAVGTNALWDQSQQGNGTVLRFWAIAAEWHSVFLSDFLKLSFL